MSFGSNQPVREKSVYRKGYRQSRLSRERVLCDRDAVESCLTSLNGNGSAEFQNIAGDSSVFFKSCLVKFSFFRI